MPGAHAVLSSLDDGSIPFDSASTLAHSGKASMNLRGLWLLQEATETLSRTCGPDDPNCSAESAKIMVLFISLCATIAIVICAFNFFREDREEQITPLCPQLVVKDTELKFSLPALPLFSQGESTNNMEVHDNKKSCVCKISMDWPDPFRGSPHGVAATVRLHKSDMTLATIVARNVAVMGQGLALCRTGCEIFGFVEPEGNKYIVRHRTGVHLLTLIGSFGPDTSQDPKDQQDIWDIEGFNPVGSKVCSMKKVGDECVGKVTQHVDAGLILCAIMATYVHRRLSQPWSARDQTIAQPERAVGPGGSVGESSSGVENDAKGAGAGGLQDASVVPPINVAALRSPTQSSREAREAPPVHSSPPSATGEVMERPLLPRSDGGSGKPPTAD